MSKIGCHCGGVVPDQNIPNSIKAYFISDTDEMDMIDKISKLQNQYVSSCINGNENEWLLGNGFNKLYLDLKLSHGEILSDIAHSVSSEMMREMFLCVECGRILLEKKDGFFLSFTPDHEPVIDLFGIMEDIEDYYGKDRLFSRVPKIDDDGRNG